MLEINKQKLAYSIQGEQVAEYQTIDGEIQYIDVDGEQIPIETGNYTTGFGDPVVFYANIAFSGGEAQEQEYGFNVSDYDATLLTERGEFPLSKGDLIWLDSEIGYKNGRPDPTTADFVIVGVKPALETTKYMLKANVK